MSIETKEELSIIQDVENDQYVSLKDSQMQEMQANLKTAATNTIEKMTKRKSISIRLIEDDIDRLKAKAANLGIPYQTLISSIVHQYSHGELGKAV